MVKFLVVFLLFVATVFGDVNSKRDDLLYKVRTFVSDNVYMQNRAFINIIFSPTESFYKKDNMDIVKIVTTLKNNGLLKLSFKKPRDLRFNFISSANPLFFIKIMNDTLRNIGYYRYVTVSSTLKNFEFTWHIELKSEYISDPLILDNELKKSGCKITDIKMDSITEWSYVIDSTHAFLNVKKLENAKEDKLKRSLYPHWLNVSNIKNLKIKSSLRDKWYPYIAYYDSSLHLLNVIEKNAKSKYMNLKMPKDAYYIKISDLYTLKNVKDSLDLYPSGVR